MIVHWISLQIERGDGSHEGSEQDRSPHVLEKERPLGGSVLVPAANAPDQRGGSHAVGEAPNVARYHHCPHHVRELRLLDQALDPLESLRGRHGVLFVRIASQDDVDLIILTTQIQNELPMSIVNGMEGSC